MYVVISVDRLFKQYRLGMVGSGTLSHDLNRWWCCIRGRPDPYLKVTESNDRTHKGDSEFVWALKDINFEVKRGEVLGIIGANGAGKSTLLKILSRVTAPTTGEVKIKGRIASLLEVGTGFHPELTGRDNVFLNGAILGMTKVDIKARFDEIVAFSGCERYIDTPVKRYSSGMTVRLGFAVAAHLEPEILIVDEVLAVGDLEFQRKCLGKMEDVARAGRTVLFVSHRMEAIRALCSRALLLNAGEVVADGSAVTTIKRYHDLQRDSRVTQHTAVGNSNNRRGSGKVRLSDISIIGEDGREKHHFEIGENIFFKLAYEVLEPVDCLYASVSLRSGRTLDLIGTSIRQAVSETPLAKGETGSFLLRLPKPPLRTGEFPLYFWLGDKIPKAYDVVDDLTHPLIIHTSKPVADLGYDPSKPTVYFEMASSIDILSRSNQR